MKKVIQFMTDNVLILIAALLGYWFLFLKNTGMVRAFKFVNIILKNEGFYSNDKDDSGGATKYGISDTRDGKRDGMIDIDLDGKPDKKVKDITISDAVSIYKRDYFDRLKIDQFKNELLALHVFDMGVNAGVAVSAKLLQKVIGAAVDGKIGNETLSKANSKDYSEAFIKARIDYYKSLKNPKYINGWLNRVQNTTGAI